MPSRNNTRRTDYLLMDDIVQLSQANTSRDAAAMSTFCEPGGARSGAFDTDRTAWDQQVEITRRDMLAVVPQLIRSDLRIEIEVVAAVAPGSATTGQDA